MRLVPWMLGNEPETVVTTATEVEVEELTEGSIDNFLSAGRAVQAELCKVPLAARLTVLHQLGDIWRARSMDGELRGVRSELMRSTGYSEANMDLEMSLVPQALDQGSLEENIDLSLPGGRDSTERFVPLGRSGEVRHLPAGPVLIIASGNSIVPAVIPTALSLALGNCTMVKPSMANHHALQQVFEPLRELAYHDQAANLMAQSLAVAYFTHDSPRLRHLLSNGELGVVNYWGGEPGRSEVLVRAATNPHHPRWLSHGPLTGFAIIAQERSDDRTARGLAENMVLYEQQLCSSPTLGAFIGTKDEAVDFASKVAAHLQEIGTKHATAQSDDLGFIRASSLRIMELCGSTVLRSKDGSNPWSIAVTPGGSVLDEALISFPAYGPHVRRRFMELVVVSDTATAVDLIARLPGMKAYQGVDKVQTVGLSLSEHQHAEAKAALLATGAYRLVPLDDMYRRDPAEPYDGSPLASLFAYAMYHRARGP
ncbi:MAG: aldehyde dehydrogenase family protein [Methanomassiliicoccus sp.]|nr:aldehyde dehydrogenase family protein [Methanomassiliicoccus sp.]